MESSNGVQWSGVWSGEWRGVPLVRRLHASPLAAPCAAFMPRT